jgi:hypothetical protein
MNQVKSPPPREDRFQGTSMSSPKPRHSHGEDQIPPDGLESIVGALPIVLPLAGGVLIFLLAFIAIYMA